VTVIPADAGISAFISLADRDIGRAAGLEPAPYWLAANN